MFPKVSQIRTPEQAAKVLAAAKADNDGILYPTHVAERNGEIIGCASMAAVPLMLIWSHSQKVGPRDSLHLKRVYDAIMETKGNPAYFVACNAQSPYHDHMEKLGCKPIWHSGIYVSGVDHY